MRLFSVLGAYVLIVNNDLIHYSMFAVLVYFKYSPEGHVSDDDYIELRQILSHDPTSIDELEKHCTLTIEQLSSMLLMLELHGEVELLSGGRYALVA